jgi:hypothetical protein
MSNDQIPTSQPTVPIWDAKSVLRIVHLLKSKITCFATNKTHKKGHETRPGGDESRELARIKATSTDVEIGKRYH